MKLPIIIIVIGMIVAVASCFITGILKEPVIKEHAFEYSVTYKLDGEVQTFEGVFRCSFGGYDGYDDHTTRHYVGEYTQNGKVLDSPSFTVAKKNGFELYIIACTAHVSYIAFRSNICGISHLQLIFLIKTIQGKGNRCPT